MKLVCLCPTYGRPRLVENTIALFLHQKIRDGDRAHLLILDDAGQITEQEGGSGNLTWSVRSTPHRFPSMPAKYNAMWRWARADGYAVVDDDDVYLSHHLRAVAEVLERHSWAHPATVFSTYGKSIPGETVLEDARGRFHGSLAVRSDLLKRIGGWPESGRETFDQEMIRLVAKKGDSQGYPDAASGPSYVFRWGDTGAAHLQHVMGKSDWYERFPVSQPGSVTILQPRLDESSQKLIEVLERV